jgi:putative restriction endonuclease
MAALDPDHALRVAAHEHVRRLKERYDDLVPIAVLRQGFEFGGERISLGSFQKGIHRARQQRGPAALSLVTSPNSPYDDAIDEVSGTILYAYRAGSLSQSDNRAVDAAFELQAPLIYFAAPRAAPLPPRGAAGLPPALHGMRAEASGPGPGRPHRRVRE